nr:F-box/kelch-repeat protein At3g23880-like [Ipomoea trifida]
MYDSKRRVPYKPSIRPSRRELWYIEEQFGFGFSNNMTWKVVMLLYIQDKYLQSGGTLPIEMGDSHEMVMVCSQVGDSWSWRQIDGVPHFRLDASNDFYLKGKYYLRTRNEDKHELLWFDMGDEVFGTLELPSNIGTFSVTTMNETIALLSFPNSENGKCIEIWLMNENNNNINWYKQTSIYCGASIDPAAISISDSHLLVFPCVICCLDWDDEDTYVPYLISIDLVTERRRMINVTIEKKSLHHFVSNSVGYVQVYGRDINEKWKEGPKKFGKQCMYARVYGESIYSI